MVYVAKRDPNRCPTHPGAPLRDEMIPATGWGKAEIVSLIGISRQHLSDILKERQPVSPPLQFASVNSLAIRGCLDSNARCVRHVHAEREEDVSAIPTIKTKVA